MPMASSTSSSSSGKRSLAAPLYALAAPLAVHTPSPAISLAGVWARSYPSSQSPFRSGAATAPSAPLPPYINLAQGVPGQLPSHSLRAKFAEESSKDVHHSYTGPSPALLDGLAKQLNQVYRNGRRDGPGAITRDDVCISAGCNMACEFAFRTVAEPGTNDGIVLPTPYYFNHATQLTALSIHPVALPCAPPNYLPDPAAFEALLEHHKANPSLTRIKALVLVTPNNPTGAIYPSSLIVAFASICKKNRIALIMDETYRDFLLRDDGSRVNAKPHGLFDDNLNLADDSTDAEWDWRGTIMQLYSFSKGYSIPGHRLGALVAHPALFAPPPPSAQETPTFGPVAKAVDNTIISPPRFDTQEAIAWAMHDEAEMALRAGVAEELANRARVLQAAMGKPVPLQTLQQWGLDGEAGSQAQSVSAAELGWSIESVGGYYAFVKHSFNQGQGQGQRKHLTSTDVAEMMAVHVGVGVLPADFFMPPEAPSDAHGKELHEDIAANRLRFSLANVQDSSVMEEVAVRLVLLSRWWAATQRQTS